MNRFGRSILCTMLLVPVAAMASEGRSYLDLFYVPSSDLEISDSSGTITTDGGNGFGFRGRVATADTFFLQGEYQKNEYDGFEGVDLPTEATAFRLGGGLSAAESGLYGVFEYLKFGLKLEGFFDEDDAGYGAHVGFRSAGPSHAYGQIGIVDAGDFGDGIEFMIGGVIAMGPASGLFVDYRRTQLEDDAGGEAEISDIRAGFRLRF